ncbi:hypothetical protein [Hyphomicrobium sp.]|uniref:hypothetical protein n=1 Tax=Hyphomicrobium sp. TaxID=82 RepID=UPI0025C505C1|nr:hypothetical protein [Hyphomicrobium sp.]MCC7252152.1 hypothetical protein [Hyphomicrobium sp.]
MHTLIQVIVTWIGGAAVVEISDTFGLWTRSLIVWPDGRRDTTTFAGWLQGPTLFADLRQPVDPPSFDGVACLNDLGPVHFHWLARQEGFAGRFVRAGDAFEWQRIIDFQCTSANSDAGYLVFEDDVLVEQGRDIPYIEHWHRAAREVSPLFAARLQDPGGRQGVIVRAGAIFMYVRDRAKPLAFNGSLPDMVLNSTAGEARALLDCEISLGHVSGDHWTIERSSLPYRVGTNLSASFAADHTSVAVSDLADDGTAFTRRWAIVDLDVGAPNKTIQGSEVDEAGSPLVFSETGRAS